MQSLISAGKKIFFSGCYDQLQKKLRHSKEKLTFFNEYSTVQTSFITLPKGFSELIYNKLMKKKRKIKLAYNIILQVNVLKAKHVLQQYPNLSLERKAKFIQGGLCGFAASHTSLLYNIPPPPPPFPPMHSKLLLDILSMV